MQLVGRSEAIKQGLKRYFTGKPCKRGHVAERLTSCGRCVGCHSSQKSRWIRTEKGRMAKAIWDRRDMRRRVIRRKGRVWATPPWADRKAIVAFYKNCPAGFEVDHIVPLNGHNVCGLHILENLRYLSIQDNRKKANRLDSGLAIGYFCPVKFEEPA